VMHKLDAQRTRLPCMGIICGLAMWLDLVCVLGVVVLLVQGARWSEHGAQGHLGLRGASCLLQVGPFVCIHVTAQVLAAGNESTIHRPHGVAD
jgi:hypothetical protein